MKNKPNYLFFFFVILYVILTYPSLSGSFELDDYGNLSKLSLIHDSTSFFYFILNGLSSTLGRPLSLLTFALQSENWPKPYFFNRVNVGIHIVNSILVVILFNQLIQSLFSELPKKNKKQFTLALSGLWLLAPIHLFTTFYVIQRMTLLLSLFILIALCIHVYIRRNGFRDSLFKSYLIISLSLISFLLLGILSKESGILLCVYILVIEFTFLKNTVQPKYWPVWRSLFLVLPLFLLILYLGATGRLIYNTVEIFDVNWYQRLLNESLILWQYIQFIIFPQFGAYGLIHDDYKVIHTFSDNYWSIPAILGIFTLISLAVIFRKKYPIPAFGILWFFGGHLLESTVLPLELYFEHRNYLPSLGILACLVYLVYQMFYAVHSKFIKGLIYSAIICYSLLYTYVLYTTAISWSSSHALAEYQLKYHPDSLRAQIAGVSYLFQAGRHDDALLLMNHIGKTRPDLVGHKLQLQMLNCFDERFLPPEKERFFYILKTGQFDFAIDSSITQLFDFIRKGECPRTSYAKLRDIIGALKENNNVYKHLWEILTIYTSKTYAEEKNWEEALRALNEAPKNRKKRIDFYLLKLKYQYMLSDRDGAMNTITFLEKRFSENPKEKLLYSGSVNVFIEHINNTNSRKTLK